MQSMSQETMLEKLHLNEEKNLLIQGLPSSIEKQFAKLSFAKNVTPLLKTRRIDWALVFAINQSQLNGILKDVLPAMQENGKLWVAYPKQTSKIASDLNRDCNWNALTTSGYEGVSSIALDHVWTALRFSKGEILIKTKIKAAELSETISANGVDKVRRVVSPPADLQKMLNKNKEALEFFDGLSFTNKKEYVTWIAATKKEDTRAKRVQLTIDKLNAGKRNPSEK
jgi:hypothetical protein